MADLREARFMVQLFASEKANTWYSKEEPKIIPLQHKVVFTDLHSGKKKIIFGGAVVISEFEFPGKE